MSGALSALEVEDLVTVRDVVTVLQRAEMVRRIAEEIEGYIVELGADGRLILLQLEELMGGVEDDRRYVIRDYSRATSTARMDDAIGRLSELSTTRILDLREVARLLDLTGGEGELDASVAPRATGCWPRSRGCRTPSSPTSSSGSAPCTRSCAPPSATSTRSKGWEAAGPVPSRTGCPAWPRRAFSTATADRKGPEPVARGAGQRARRVSWVRSRIR